MYCIGFTDWLILFGNVTLFCFDRENPGNTIAPLDYVPHKSTWPCFPRRLKSDHSGTGVFPPGGENLFRGKPRLVIFKKNFFFFFKFYLLHFLSHKSVPSFVTNKTVFWSDCSTKLALWLLLKTVKTPFLLSSVHFLRILPSVTFDVNVPSI